MPQAMRLGGRGLLAGATVLGLALLLPARAEEIAPPPAQALPVTPLSLAALAPGVYLHQPAIGDWGASPDADVANLGVVVGERCVAVIDSGGSPGVGRALRAAIARLTPKPVCYVIDTHAHPDHLLGNRAFAGSGPGGADPQFVAHHRFSAALAARERRFLGGLQREIDPAADASALVHPSLTVDTTLDLDLGGRTLRLQAWPTAHTDNDLSVLDLASRTLFLGDLWFVGHLPVLDGSLRGWLGVMERLARIDAACAVPGHGAPSADWPEALKAQRDYLSGLLASTRAAVKARLTMGQAVEQSRVDNTGWQLSELFHRRNVTAAFAELEWED